MADVHLVDAVRTPFGKYGGAVAGVRPDDLAAAVLRALIGRSPALDPARIDDVIFGNANGAGEENRNVARMAVLLAGLPVTVPGATVNRLCGSGLEAVIQAYRDRGRRRVDRRAGGVESMSRAPYVLAKPERADPVGDQTLVSTTLGWRMVNPAMPAEWTVSLGEGAELIADRYSITRTAQNEYALDSHQKAGAAWADGAFASEITQVPGAEMVRDESIRPDTSMAALGRLKPAFRPGGTVTAGNSSPLNDGASAVLLADDAGLAALGREPLATIRAGAVTALEPQMFGLGPVEAIRRAVAKAGIGLDAVRLLELNEAFAAQTLGCLAGLPEIDPKVINPRGGAVAVGHPLGASGARLVGAVGHQLAAGGGGVGVAALCIGVGQGLALVLQR